MLWPRQHKQNWPCVTIACIKLRGVGSSAEPFDNRNTVVFFFDGVLGDESLFHLGDRRTGDSWASDSCADSFTDLTLAGAAAKCSSYCDTEIKHD